MNNYDNPQDFFCLSIISKLVFRADGLSSFDFCSRQIRQGLLSVGTVLRISTYQVVRKSPGQKNGTYVDTHTCLYRPTIRSKQFDAPAEKHIFLEMSFY